MEKFTFYSGALLLAATISFSPGANAQNLLNETFEGITVPSGSHYGAIDIEGWETVDRDPSLDYPMKWCIYESKDKDGNHVNSKAWIDAMYNTDANVKGSDYLLTPWVQVDGPMSVRFSWAASAWARDDKKFDLRVRIVEEGKQPGDQDFIFSIQDPKMVLESGVQPVDYGWYTVSWEGWAKNVSTLDLSDYQGKKVRVAFEYYIDGNQKINSIEVDDVSIFRTQAITGPVATPSIDEWDFGKVYIGSKSLSEVFTLTNTGKDVLKVTGVEAPEGFSVIAATPMADIALGRNEAVKMQIMYDASNTSATSGTLTINTNGEDASISVRASKQMLPEGYTYEGFESCGEVFPPAGWYVSNGKDWRVTSSPIEGYYAAYASATMNNTAQELRTPRIDGSAGEVTFEFNYYDYFEDEDGMGADNTVTVEFSKDGGNSWTTLETFNYNGPYNENTHKKYTVQTGGSDNCYFRFAYSPLEEWDTETGPLVSTFYVDAVILPPLYGASNAPAATTLTAPANGATGIFPRNIVLTWDPAQFAKGYKLYVGTDAAATSLVNGVEMGEALTYTIPAAEYETTYYWRVDAYNDKGTTASSTYTFTTQPDASVTAYPYRESFDGDVFPPTGWVADNAQYTRWYRSETKPYEGKYAANVQAGLAGEVATFTTPDFKLPADNPMYLTFYWGDCAPVTLKVDETGTRTNPTDGSNGIADLDLEIFVDGEWKAVTKLSDPNDTENRYWYRERIDLTPYAGKTVAFRWKRSIFNYNRATSALIDKMAVEPIVAEKLTTNFSEWDAMKVNADNVVASGNKFTLLNDGNSEATVADVTFSGTHFTSTLNKGDKIASGSGIPFSISFAPGKVASAVEETMTITSEGGSTVTMTLRGEGMPEDTQFFGFEQDEYGSLQPNGFITIDGDGASSIKLAMVDYANYGKPQAFVVMNYTKADWPNPYPATGMQNLVAFATYSSTTDDWIIMPNITATENSEFEFWARNYEKKDNIGGGEVFTQGCSEVLVSTADDPNDTKAYTKVASYTLNYPEKEEYTQYITNLGEYAGDKIHVAMRHTVNTDGLAYLFDDFTYRHFDFSTSGVKNVLDDSNVTLRISDESIMLEGVEDAMMSIYSTSGVMYGSVRGNVISTSGLAAGIYLLRVDTVDGSKTMRFVKK